MHKGGRRCLVLTLGLLGVQLLVVNTAAAFCPAVVKNYAKPLMRLPNIAEPPQRLPFAPAAIVVKPVDTGELVSESKIAVGLVFNGRSQKKLQWHVRTRLIKYGNGSTVLREASKTLRAIRPKQSRAFILTSNVLPALYRWETEIATISGKRLGRFGENFRVVKPYVNAKFSFENASVAPGETLQPCLENLGTESIVYGEKFRIERYSESGWAVVPALTHSSGESLIGYWNGPGSAASHWSVTLPLNSDVGSYRFVVDAEASGSSRPLPFVDDPRPVTIAGEFTVSQTSP